MNMHVANWLLFVGGIAVAACDTAPGIIKSAQSDEVRKETMVGVELPPDCLKIAETFPAGQATFDLHYREPATTQDGKVMDNLAYTTIYLRSSNGQTKAIRIPSKDSHGGASLTVRDIPVSSSEIVLCITATNYYGKESPPGFPSR